MTSLIQYAITYIGAPTKEQTVNVTDRAVPPSAAALVEDWPWPPIPVRALYMPGQQKQIMPTTKTWNIGLLYRMRPIFFSINSWLNKGKKTPWFDLWYLYSKKYIYIYIKGFDRERERSRVLFFVAHWIKLFKLTNGRKSTVHFNVEYAVLWHNSLIT